MIVLPFNPVSRMIDFISLSEIEEEDRRRRYRFVIALLQRETFERSNNFWVWKVRRRDLVPAVSSRMMDGK